MGLFTATAHHHVYFGWLSNLMSPDMVIIWVFWGGSFALISGLVGAKRYIGRTAGFVLGFFLGPLGLGIVFCSNKKEQDFVFPVSFESIPDQIKKYKNLFDSGAITEEEYNLQKAKLLNQQ